MVLSEATHIDIKEKAQTWHHHVDRLVDRAGRRIDSGGDGDWDERQMPIFCLYII